MPEHKYHGKTSRLVPDNWRERHAPDCPGDCLDHLEDEQYWYCPVWSMEANGEWQGDRPPIAIGDDGKFFDRYGQVCQVLADVPESVPEGKPALVNLGVIEALSPPGWDGRAKLGNHLYQTQDTMILGPDEAMTLLGDMQHFIREGFVPQREKTARGFGVNSFKDTLGQECSFQDSSLATEAAVWLGVDVNCAGERVSNRMHLTADMISGLIPILDRFTKTFLRGT